MARSRGLLTVVLDDLEDAVNLLGHVDRDTKLRPTTRTDAIRQASSLPCPSGSPGAKYHLAEHELSVAKALADPSKCLDAAGYQSYMALRFHTYLYHVGDTARPDDNEIRGYLASVKPLNAEAFAQVKGFAVVVHRKALEPLPTPHSVPDE